jgi:hypothetical protein
MQSKNGDKTGKNLEINTVKKPLKSVREDRPKDRHYIRVLFYRYGSAHFRIPKLRPIAVTRAFLMGQNKNVVLEATPVSKAVRAR